MPTNAELLIEEYRARRNDSITMFSSYEEIAQYLMPHSSNIVTMQAPGNRMTQRIYDITGIDALDKLRTTLTSNMTPKTVKWFSMASREQDINLRPEVRKWYDRVEKLMFDARNDSNFHRVNPRFIGDTVGIGTGAMMQTEADKLFAPDIQGRFRGLQYNYAPVGTYVIDEDGFGRPDLLIRRLRMHPTAMLHRWKDTVSKEVREMSEKAPTRWVELLHAVRPRYAEGRWESLYVDSDHRTELSEEFFQEFPWTISRWEQLHGEILGRGRGFIALPEVITLNTARRQKLRYWAKTIDPPMQVLNRGVIGKVRLTASALITVNQMDILKPIETGTRFGGRFDHNAIPEAESKQQIRAIFWTDQLAQFERQGKTPPTATEIIERLELLRQLVGPAIEGLQDEAYRPDLQRQFLIMMRAGALPLPPPIIQQLGTTIDFIFEGPFARAQKSIDLKSLNDALIITQGLAQLIPDVLDHFDGDAIARDIPTLTNIPQRYTRDPGELPVLTVSDIRAERAKQRQQLEQQQAALAQSEVANQSASAQRSLAQATQAQAAA